MVSLKPKINEGQVLLFNLSVKVCCLLLLLLLGEAVTPASAQSAADGGDILPVPSAYRTEGIPAIKKSEVENLFYEPSAIRSNLIWDADRKNRRMLVTDESNYLYLLDTPLAQPVKLIDKVIPQSVKFNPDGESFAYTSDHENEDNYQLYVFDFKGKTARKLITLTGKDESIDSFVWSRSGDSLFYVRVDYDAKVTKLCRYDFRAEECFPASLKGVWNVIQAGGDKILLKNSRGSSSQLLYVYDFGANKLIPIEEKGNSRKSFLVGDTVFWTSEGSDDCGKEPCILSLNLKNNKMSRLKLPEDLSSIYDVKISPEGNNVLIQETKDGVDRLHVFRLKKDKLLKEIPAFVFGSYVIWNTRWLSDNEIAYTLENIGKPASIKSYNIDTKKITDWTKERLPAQLANKVKAPEVFKWQSLDGREISGYVVRSAVVQGKSPVLIYVHGGPPVLDRPVFNSQDIGLSANLGMTIIHTNIRGSSGFGKEFMDADNREKRVDAINDVRALIDWIDRQPDLDTGQIYLRGGSYGGFIALAAALQEPGRIKGVIAEYPLVSIRGFLSQSYIDEIAKNEYGDPKDEPLMKKLDALSPLDNTTRWNKIPLFLTRGKLDARVPEKDVTELKNQLQNTGAELWYIYSNEDGHGFGGEYVFAAMYQFLKKQTDKNKQENKK